MRRFLQEERRAEGEDSGHCGTIRTKVAIATEFKGAEEWRPMQIEGFFAYVATVPTDFSRIMDTGRTRFRLPFTKVAAIIVSPFRYPATFTVLRIT